MMLDLSPPRYSLGTVCGGGWRAEWTRSGIRNAWAIGRGLRRAVRQGGQAGKSGEAKKILRLREFLLDLGRAFAYLEQVDCVPIV